MAYRLTTQDVDALSDYDAVPNDIEGFTTQELVDELYKRNGVRVLTEEQIKEIRSPPLSEELEKELNRVLDDYCKWDDTHWTTQRIKEYKKSLRNGVEK